MVEGKVYHLRLKEGDVAKYVLLPRDPDRVSRASSRWDSFKEVAVHRSYVTHTGYYKGVKISSVSTGIGGPSASIVMEELLRVGADTFIRIGTRGSLKREVEVGDLVISAATVRLDGASKIYAIPEYPAHANYEVLLALIEAAEALGAKYTVGVTASIDSFYVGQGRPGFRGYVTPWTQQLVKHLKEAGITNFEMEAATIFVLSSIYGARAGGMMAVIDNIETGGLFPTPASTL